MPHFTLQLDPSGNGPLLNVQFGVSIARREALAKAGSAIPNNVSVHALIDTGASCTCIDPFVVQSLGLESRGKVSIATPSTGSQDKTVDAYDVSVIIWATANQQPFFQQTIPVVEAELLARLGYHALIGRDILSHCHLTYNGVMKFFILGY